MSSSSYVPTQRLSFLVKYSSSLASLRRKIKEKKTENIRIIDHTDDIKRLKEELKTAKESIVPPSYNLDERGGDKIIDKVKGIVNDLIEVDGENEEHYNELLGELNEMKDNRRLNLDSQKKTSSDGGTTIVGWSSSSMPMVLPSDDGNNQGDFVKAIDELSSPIMVDRLLRRIPLVEIYASRCKTIFENVEVSKGVLINWLIGIGVIDDPLDGENFLGELLLEPSFNLLCGHNSSRITVKPDFIKNLISLKSSSLMFEVGSEEDWLDLLMINFNESVCKLNLEKWKEKLVKVVHLGNFLRGTGHVVVKDTFYAEFDKLLMAKKLIRFLSLRGVSRIETLPNSIGDVTELRVLDLRSCQDLKSLPKEIERLINLVHLDISECYQLESIPKGISRLINLRVLLGFIIIDSNQQSAEFDDLKHLIMLIKLTVRTRRATFPTIKDLETLSLMKNLRKLKFAWVKSFVEQSTSPADVSNEIIRYTDGLPENLEKLELQAAPDTAVSSLLGVISKSRSHHRKLEKLYIKGGSLQKLYQGRHCFPYVKRLRLRYLPQLYMKWGDFKRSFPNLSYLHVAECPNLIFFPCDQYGEWIQSEASW